MKKQSAVPMKVVLAMLAERAKQPPPRVAQRVVGNKAREAAKRVVKAIVMPEEFIRRGLPPAVGAGGQPAKAKIGLLARLFEEMEKGSTADAYLLGFMEKMAQAGAAPETIVKAVKPELHRQFLDAVPPDPKAGRKAYEQLLSAGGIGIGDFRLKDVTKLDPKRRAAMEEAAKRDLAGIAGVEDFVAGKNPYSKWTSPVRSRAFPKVQKGYNALVADFVKKNPELIREFIASRAVKPEAKK